MYVKRCFIAYEKKTQKNNLASKKKIGTVNGHCPFAVTNQSENSKYNLISV